MSEGCATVLLRLTQGTEGKDTRAMRLTDEQIWDQLGILADGDWTLADLWDRARLLGVRPSQFLRPCRHRSAATAA